MGVTLTYLLTLLLVESTMGSPQDVKVPDVQVDDINTFLTMAWQVANHINPNSSCYVCGLLPYTAGEGLPLMALPASNCDTCHVMHLPSSQSYSHPDCSRLSKIRPLNCSRGQTNCQKCLEAPKAVPVSLSPQPFAWCLQNDGKTPVGQSDCLRTFKAELKSTTTDFKALDSAPHQCVEEVGQARFNALAHHSASCSITSPEGMYWVCGNLAYPYLPVDYRGRCGLAYVLPAMRVTRSLPQNRRSNRVRRGTSDIFGTHHQSPFKNALGSLLPFYGVMSAFDQIADLSHSIEVIANETGKALTLISSELSSVRLLALQNRAALDFLLAAQGGTCAVIGSECCTFVPDYNATIGEIVTHLHQAANSSHQDRVWSLFDGLGNTLGSLGYSIAKVIFILFALIILLSLFVSCVKKFLFS